MPADLFVAALAPKVGAIAFGAAAVTEDAATGDIGSHQVAATSFIHLPMPRHRLMRMLVGPEIEAFNWLQDKFDGLWHRVFDGHVSSEQARMVEYYAASCPHCQHLEPVWKQAATQWAAGPEAAKVVWEQKQCLDDNWKPGGDYKECQEQQVMGFPTIRFFPPGSRTGDDFFFERTPDRLVEFAKTGINPNPSQIPRGEGEMMDVKMVDYYSAACPHCKSLDPVWATTEKKWDADFAEREDAPVVSFEKKECYDDHWKPGKDYEECRQLRVQSFPNIKLLTPAQDGHGFVAQTDYDGARNPEAIIDFLKKQADMEEPIASDQHHDDTAAKVGDAVHGNAGEANNHHIAPPVQEEESRNEPVFAAAPLVGKATIKTAPVEVAATADTNTDRGKDTFAPIPEAIKTAMAPLPLVSFSCLPGRRSPTPLHRRTERSPPKAPSSPAQFL